MLRLSTGVHLETRLVNLASPCGVPPGNYFLDHNSLIPRVELGGRTPDEAYFARELDLAERLRGRHLEARARRLETNRAARCRRCRPEEHHVTPSRAASNVP